MRGKVSDEEILKGDHHDPLFYFNLILYFQSMKNIILFIILLNLIFTEVFYGYLKQIDMSFCMDQCSEYHIEDENGISVTNVININEYNLNQYLNRFVQIESNAEFECVMCDAMIIDNISLSDNCEYPVSCFINPCEISDSCNIDIFSECIPNYCGGCHADFYDLSNNLIDCSNFIEPCHDLYGLFFGFCEMYLGVALVNGECQHISGCGWSINNIDYSNAFFSSMYECNESCNNDNNSCVEIETSYSQIFNEFSQGCNYNEECISVWGDCGQGLGGCHYSVNQANYNNELVESIVSNWISNDCIESVCDCFDLPYSYCNDGVCDISYCEGSNPSGCFLDGCDDNYLCLDFSVTNECIPSSCSCDEFSGNWFCTEDCNGGSCFQIGDANLDQNINIIDVVTIVDSILNDSFFEDIYDINRDTTVNIVDIILLIDVILYGNR